MLKTAPLTSLGLAIATTCCTPAMAQQDAGQAASNSLFDRNRGVTVLERGHPGYEASGIHAGPVFLYPRLTQTIDYNDNVFAEPANAEGDVVWLVSPEVSAATDWSRHAVNAFARATVRRYAQLTTENTTDYAVGSTGRFDVSRSANFDVGLGWARTTQSRTAASSFGLARPVQVEIGSLHFSGVKEWNRVRFTVNADDQKYNYLNRPENPPQHDNDHTTLTVSGRADYAVSPDTAAYIQIDYNDQSYRLKESPIVEGPSGPVPVYPGLTRRDSSGGQILIGADFQISALLRGDIGVGYLRQKFADPIYGTDSGLGGSGRVVWLVTPLTTISASASRTVQAATIVGAAGVLASNGALEVDHELLRNLILTGTASFTVEKYRGIDRVDHRSNVGLSATYLMNRRVGLTCGYSQYRLRSSGLSHQPDFNVHRVAATLTLQY
jgi:hypothetical protein